ncbi:MAG TPA: YjbQ family protein [Haliangiales bacterium]|nr:YjbQ family protein [Haliangiales bacterium]
MFVHHTSASVILYENADPAVRRDLEAFFARLCRDGDPLYLWEHRTSPHRRRVTVTVIG